MMGAENIRYRRNYERIFFNTTYQPTGDQQKDAIAQIGIMQNRAVQANLAYQSCRDSGALFKVLHQSIMSCMTYWIARESYSSCQKNADELIALLLLFTGRLVSPELT
nr:hypothetical protein J4V74_000350 [Escherichia coli]